MIITNEVDEEVSWFCFNADDAVRLIALGSGNLDALVNSDDPPKFDYKDVPINSNGFYGVRFTKPGGIPELAVGTVKRDGTIMLIKDDDGNYMTKSG